MGASKSIRTRFVDDLRDYTNTLAAVHLLKEALKGGSMITVGAANDIVSKENLKADAKIGNVVKAILAQAGKEGEARSLWVKNDTDNKWHLQAAITIGGAVYTVDLVQEGIVKGEQLYTVNIESKLAKDDSPTPSRGKLFFNPGAKATVKIKANKDGDLRAVTQKGLEISHDSIAPYSYQNEIIAKYCDKVSQGADTQLALAGTGSGKSIIMAGIAQSLGKTVMIVPDALLVSQQTKEVLNLVNKGIENGAPVTPINVFTLDLLEKPGLIDDPEDMDQVTSYFATVLEGTSKPKKFEHMVLQSTHPLFKVIAPLIKDNMVLIDESHTHTFDSESTKLLQGLKDNNSVLALTATPTSKLYDLFPGTPLDDLSLGAAIELGNVRPIKAEVDYYEAEDLVTQAVVRYFDDYYLRTGDNGYTDPVQLKAELLKKVPKPSDMEAQSQAIEIALERNRMRCPRNMAFSDNKQTRQELATIYQKISEGDATTINKYKDTIAAKRKQSEIEARVAMTLKFVQDVDAQKTKEVTELVTLATKTPVVDLPRDIVIEQQKGVQRTINSLALALVLNEKPSSIGEKDRTNKLRTFIEKCDAEFHGFKTEGKTGKPGEDAVEAKLKACASFNREKMRESLLKMESPIPDLPATQQAAMINLILDRAEALAANITADRPMVDIVMNPTPVNLKALEVDSNYTRTIDASTTDTTKKGIVAMLDVGIVSQVVSDQTVATGVSIKDVFNVQIVNNYSEAVESDINVINGTLSGPQAMGRCVRHGDGLARVQQIIDVRYKGTGLILTVDDAIDRQNSGVKTKAVMTARDNLQLIQKATVVQSIYRGQKTVGMFAKNRDELSALTSDIQKCRVAISTKTSMLQDGRNHLVTTKQKLHNSEVELAFIPGNPKGRIPPQYRNKPEMVRHWTQRKVLPGVIDGIVERNQQIEDSLQDSVQQLQKLEKRRNVLLAQIQSAPSTKGATVVKTKTAMTVQDAEMDFSDQSFHRGSKTHGLFAQKKQDVSAITVDIQKCKEAISTQTDMLRVGRNLLDSTKQKLHKSEVELAFIPGNPNGRIPPQYRNQPEMVRYWTQRQALPGVIDGIVERNQKLEDALRDSLKQLQKLEKQRDALLEKTQSTQAQQTVATM
ncbi:DEAD/DEAH box helicase family protein [Legionella waltersii]|uniref:Type III restriction enzyme, res subunit n=1 Tax=Legionella waltersii TaxID=66969 RepID=A0A0W1A7M6_9GAMM|nr:DEAD/DEAH box helicase family protein [Legionella waltersii]KTD77168.1 Type III restriction enzyme, res subunit [Legionella waltersii]SNV11360.1 Type III restriction enzyme, res subunit [Legionella waltersii]